MSWISNAYAMGVGQSAGGEANMLAQFFPFIAIFAVFYFLLIRPQQKKAKEQQEMLKGLKKGDAVITAGGMYGRILDVDGDVMVVDLGETRVKMGRAFLSPVPQKKQPVPPKNDKKDKKGKKGVAAKDEVTEVATAASVDELAKPENPPVVSGDDKDKPAVQ